MTGQEGNFRSCSEKVVYNSARQLQDRHCSHIKYFFIAKAEYLSTTGH